MAFSPTPKKLGDLIRSQDWNDALAEVVRLESFKLDVTGGKVSGLLSVQSLAVGTVTPPLSLPLTVRGAAEAYLNVVANNGVEVRLGADANGGIVSTMTNHDLQLRAGGNVTRLTVKADGKVGIGTTTPEGTLDVKGAIRTGTLYFTDPSHNVIGIGNALGFAAIENAANYNTLMILGRTVSTSPLKRSVSVWDELNVNGALNVNGIIRAGTSEMYFTHTSHIHSGIGNALGSAAIENASSHNTLMILGRTVNLSPFKRSVSVWDELNVNGNLAVFGPALINGPTLVNGPVTVNGQLWAPAKIGFVVDAFINAVGDTVEQGDVVVVSRRKVGWHYGAANSIPVPEVDLTERAYDTRVCGIVDSVVQADSLPPYELQGPTPEEIQAAQAEKNARRRKAAEKNLAARMANPFEKLAAPVTDDLDATQVQAGQLGKMVTLGAYAWCKVDADIAPIAVGDLLTTSPTRGHAQKVIEPGQAVGAIIGKALGARRKGKGKIPVLVSLH